MHRFLVLGVLPDDIQSVSATIGRQRSVRRTEIAVRENVFAIAAERPILVRRLLGR